MRSCCALVSVLGRASGPAVVDEAAAVAAARGDIGILIILAGRGSL
jgi:hypothetical protein